MAEPGRPRFGQNFLADTNLLDAIVRGASIGPKDVVLEVGGGRGALTRPLAAAAGHVHVIEIDERLQEHLVPLAIEHPNVEVHFADAVQIELGALDPAPTRMVSNLPYSVATPVLVKTVQELPSLREWLVMVQLEIAERLRAAPGSRIYGAPSAILQLSCEVELVRRVDPAVFTPRPRVHSALLRMIRTGAAPTAGTRRLVAASFAHRRKMLARSVALSGIATKERVHEALTELGLDPAARAEALHPSQFAALAQSLELDP